MSQRTRIRDGLQPASTSELAADLSRAANEAYDRGYDRDGHMLERAALTIEELAETHDPNVGRLVRERDEWEGTAMELLAQVDRALEILEPAASSSTAACRAIDVLKGRAS